MRFESKVRIIINSTARRIHLINPCPLPLRTTFDGVSHKLHLKNRFLHLQIEKVPRLTTPFTTTTTTKTTATTPPLPPPPPPPSPSHNMSTKAEKRAKFEAVWTIIEEELVANMVKENMPEDAKQWYRRVRYPLSIPSTPSIFIHLPLLLLNYHHSPSRTTFQAANSTAGSPLSTRLPSYSGDRSPMTSTTAPPCSGGASSCYKPSSSSRTTSWTPPLRAAASHVTIAPTVSA